MVEERRGARLLERAAALHKMPLYDTVEELMALNDGIFALGGYVRRYQIKAPPSQDLQSLRRQARPRQWEASVPASTTSDRIEGLGGQTVGPGADGMISIQAPPGPPAAALVPKVP